MPEEVTYCSECGQRTGPRWITLSNQMVQGLAFCASYGDTPMFLHELRAYFDKTPTPSTYQQFHNNRYFDLVRWAGNDKASGWLITDQGRWFLDDVHSVPRRVKVFDSMVIERDPRYIGIRQVRKIDVDLAYARSQMTAATRAELTANTKRRKKGEL